jgi:6-phosphogluconolactonase
VNVQRFPDLDALSRAAADDFAALARTAVGDRGVFHVALAGGSTPKRLYELLAARGKSELPWDETVIWFGDERSVPPNHPDSNYGMAKQALLAPLGLTAIHRMQGEREPERAAVEYDTLLRDRLGDPPELDLVLLGMGPDGHTLSLFPGTPALHEAAHLAVANPVNSPLTKGPTTRITLTARAVAAARHTRFLVAGADKAEALAAVLEGPREPDRYPSQTITGADVVWFVDAAAAQRLKP